MKSLELFSGAGGLAKGLEISGFEHMAFIEFNKDACETLKQNFKQERVFEGNIQDYDFSSLKNIDIVAGGPPCQPFSLGGKHKASDDHRDMFPYAIKAICELRPKAFIFENVKGLLRSSFSDYFDYILLRLEYTDFSQENYSDWREHFTELKKLRSCKKTPPEYKVEYKLINAADHGVPQTRERVFIVGLRSDITFDWVFSKGQHNLERLLWEQYVSGEYWDRHNISFCNYDHTPHFQKRIELIKNKYGMFPPEGKAWVTMRDVLGALPVPEANHLIDDHVFRNGARSYPGHTGSMFDLPSKTIKAGGHGVPGGENMIRYPDNSIRYLTVHEAKIIQGFPRDFKIHGAWGEAMRQIGNAVPTSISEEIGTRIFDLIKKSTKKKEAA